MPWPSGGAMGSSKKGLAMVIITATKKTVTPMRTAVVKGSAGRTSSGAKRMAMAAAPEKMAARKSSEPSLPA